MNASKLLPPTWTGHSALDRDHAELFSTLERLQVCLVEGRVVGSARACLDFLAVYTVQHFETEESLMRLAHYPRLEAHRQEHEGLVRLVADLRHRLEAGEVPESDVATLLIEAFERHIQTADQAYIPWLAPLPKP